MKSERQPDYRTDRGYVLKGVIAIAVYREGHDGIEVFEPDGTKIGDTTSSAEAMLMAIGHHERRRT